MQNENTPPRQVPQAKPRDRFEGRVGLRGCAELILKLIIGLILIGSLISQLLGEGEPNLFVVIVLIILIILLIWLILRQKHLVVLNCDLTQPTGCVHGDTTIESGKVLEPIVGTASGIGFSRYELEVIHDGTTSIPAAVVYADTGSPDYTPPFGNNQVTNGTLGFVDVQQAVAGAGAAFLTSTNFEVRLHVIGIDNSIKTCTSTFQISAARSYIKKVGAGWSHNYIDPSEELCRVDPPHAPPVDPASVGGSIYVRGAANAFGCMSEQIAELRLWAIPDPGFAFGQPANGTPSVTPAGGTKISEAFYANNSQRNNNKLDGTSNEGNILTFAPGWTTREECWYFDGPPTIEICFTVPDLAEVKWATPASGQYTLLLEVQDTLGNTYYDIQRVWIDNDPATAQVSSIGGLGPCVDLRLSDFVGTTAEIRGIAWDPPVDGAQPQAEPNDNFNTYSLSFQKNGGSPHPITAATPGVRVPPTWPGPLPAGADGVLADWDIITALDGGPGPLPPGSEKLAHSERCAYVIEVHVSDKTLVGEGGSHHHKEHDYAINIINDLG